MSLKLKAYETLGNHAEAKFYNPSQKKLNMRPSVATL